MKGNARYPMKIDKFEGIEAWWNLTQAIYQVTAQGKFAKDFGLQDQSQQAAVSIMANISEGFDSQSNKVFIQFLGVCTAFSDRGAVAPIHCPGPGVYLSGWV